MLGGEMIWKFSVTVVILIMWSNVNNIKLEFGKGFEGSYRVKKRF